MTVILFFIVTAIILNLLAVMIGRSECVSGLGISLILLVCWIITRSLT